MPGELITIGDELLAGRVVNSNAAHIAQHLRLQGFELRWITVVGDRQDDIIAALDQAVERASFILATGGLGPTDDDRTSEAAARALHRPLRRDPISWDIISGHLKKLHRPMTPGVAKMADLPEGATRIDLNRPRAGFYIGDAAKPIFFLPGIPEEMADMLATFVLPTLEERLPRQRAIGTRVLRIFGLWESQINQRLADLADIFPDLTVGYLPHFPENRLTLTAQAPTSTETDNLLEQAVALVVHRLGHHVYGQEDDTLEMVVGRLLAETGLSLALAESCTGGLIAHLITNASGSSAYFDRALVTYSDTAKSAHLQVPEDLIAQHSAVSAQVAEAMARGLHHLSRADLNLAVTGLAGSTGGRSETPVGTVFLALLRDEAFRLEQFQFRGTRQEIKTLAAYTALDWVRRAIIDDDFFVLG
jgi:nicotinamide-nucleotide amidase